MNNNKKIRYVCHEDDEMYDEIKIKMVPRYKTSELSGDEWRVSANLEFYLKGELIFQRSFSRLETAIAALPWFFKAADEQGECDLKALERARQKCSQVGCSNPPCTEYRLKATYCKDGHKTPAEERPWSDDRIRFCEKHLRRGDCGLQDSDENYEVVSGPGPNETDWRGANISESARVVVKVDNIDDLPKLIGQALKEKQWEDPSKQ